MLKRYWKERPGEGADIIAVTLGEWHAEPSMGCVLFNEEQLTWGVVAHEAFHMATGYVRQMRRSVNLRADVSDEEERIGDTLHICVDQIVGRLKQLGVTVKVE